MRQLAAICADVGVEILPTTAKVVPGTTTAVASLQRVLDHYGEGHLIQVLRTLVETENLNRARLDAFAVFAVSEIMLARPDWANSGLRWYEVFDTIDLGALQRQAKMARDVAPQRHVLAGLLFAELHREFVPPAPPKRDRKAEAAEAKAARDAALLALIEQKIELGRQLAELRDVTPRNTAFGHIVRHKFDLPHPNVVAQMIRVWKRYGNRPDIVSKVRNWRVLADLTRTLLPERARLDFEAKILGGEKVLAKTIAAKAGARKTGRPSKVAVTAKRQVRKQMDRSASPAGRG